ncbi:MAG: GC-type dockerin domain-anchored protein [Phycisphaerales bacterium]
MNTMTMSRVAAMLVAAGTGECLAQTTQINPNRYRVESGVAFELLNSGANHYLFAWTDSSGTFSGVIDPTLEIVVGQTYTFQRFSGSHPFAICNDTLPVAGDDGSFQRTTFSSTVILDATLPPAADFTADPGPTTDFISWTPTEAEIGEYFYTCTIASHPAMTGKIVVIAADEPCLADTNGNGVADPGDFTAWVTAFNAGDVPVADQNQNGVLDPGDFTAWVVNFNAGC